MQYVVILLTSPPFPSCVLVVFCFTREWCMPLVLGDVCSVQAVTKGVSAFKGVLLRHWCVPDHVNTQGIHCAHYYHVSVVLDSPKNLAPISIALEDMCQAPTPLLPPKGEGSVPIPVHGIGYLKQLLNALSQDNVNGHAEGQRFVLACCVILHGGSFTVRNFGSCLSMKIWMA